MAERPGDESKQPPPSPKAPPSGDGYGEDEEAEVRKRLEDLGYVE